MYKRRRDRRLPRTQLDFHDEAANLAAFRANFGSPFWRATVSFPAPVADLVSADVRPCAAGLRCAASAGRAEQGVPDYSNRGY